MTDAAKPSSTVEAEAVAWLLRLESPDAGPGDWAAVEAWLEASPDRRAAYDRAEALWAELSDLAPELRQAMALTASAAPAARRSPSRDSRAAKARRRPWWYAAAALAAASLAFAVFLAPERAPAWQAYATAKGEDRLLILADNSRIHLNSGSRIAVRIGGRTREVRMDDAEASFDVAHDPSRPFVIVCGDRTIRVVGTEFNVLRHDGLLRVTVRRGVVEVAPVAPAAPSAVVRLVAGDQLTRKDGDAATVARDDPEVAFAWSRRELIYRKTPLPEVVSDLNRYFTIPIVLDPELAKLTFSGVLMIDSEDAVVRRLEAFLPLSVDRSPQSILLAARER